MAALVCDICGGKLVMGTGGMGVCDSCSMEHSKDRMQEKVQEIKGTVAVSNIASLESLMKRGHLALEDSKWEEADGFFGKVLDLDPEHAPAYIGKLCAEVHVHQEYDLPYVEVTNEVVLGHLDVYKLFREWGSYGNKAVGLYREKTGLGISEAVAFLRHIENVGPLRPLENLKYFEKALRFANMEYRTVLNGYNQVIKERIAEQERRKQEVQRKSEETQHSNEQYHKWKKQGLCRHCGGQMGGFFTKKCKSCGKAQ